VEFQVSPFAIVDAALTTAKEAGALVRRKQDLESALKSAKARKAAVEREVQEAGIGNDDALAALKKAAVRKDQDYPAKQDFAIKAANEAIKSFSAETAVVLQKANTRVQTLLQRFERLKYDEKLFRLKYDETLFGAAKEVINAFKAGDNARDEGPIKKLETVRRRRSHTPLRVSHAALRRRFKLRASLRLHKAS
jgi:hypothetical protein